MGLQEMKEQKRDEKRQKKLLEKGDELQRLVEHDGERPLGNEKMLFVFDGTVASGEKKPKKEKKKKKSLHLKSF